MNIFQTLENIKKQFRGGEKKLAIEIGEKISKQYPDNIEVKKTLGKMYLLCNQNEKAIKKFEEILVTSPTDEEVIFNLSIIYSDTNDFDSAFKNLKKYIEIKPSDYAGWLNLAELQIQIKDYESSIKSSLEVLKINPLKIEAFNNIGICQYHLRKYEEAAIQFDNVIKIDPLFADAYVNKGSALRGLGEHEKSLVNYDSAIKINPVHIEAWFNKGNALRCLKQYEYSIKCYEKVISLKSDHIEAWLNKGATLDDLKRFEEALKSFDAAISIEPNFAKAWANKAMTLSNLREFEKSIKCYEISLKINPEIECVFGDLLHTKMKICDWSEFYESVEFCEKKILESKQVISPLALLSLIDKPTLHKLNSELFIRKRIIGNHQIRTKNINNKIKVGYFSANFNNHAVSYLTAQLFENHNHNKFEIHGFSFGPNIQDEMRQRVSKSFYKFHDVNHLSNNQIVHLSRNVGIDIAIDLMGYTQDSRWEIFSARCAPIQVNYLGYPGTMGADFIDYIVADKVVIPKNVNNDYLEKIIYLPNCYMVNDSSKKVSKKIFDRKDFGLPDNAFVFCCFNNSYKITPKIFEIWMDILKNVENSVLWLFEENHFASKNLILEAIKRGVSKDRIIYAKRVELMEDHLAKYKLADLFLDTTPYNAHTTASDALWADLPVLTSPGKSFASRVAASLLRTLNLDELVVDSLEKYASQAIFLANNPYALTLIKDRLKKNKYDSTLFNSEVFARNIEKSYEAIYQRHIKNLPPCEMEII